MQVRIGRSSPLSRRHVVASEIDLWSPALGENDASRIEATVVRRAPQVMVKVTGGGCDTRAIAAHFRYISKNGRLETEDDRGETLGGKWSVRDLA